MFLKVGEFQPSNNVIGVIRPDLCWAGHARYSFDFIEYGNVIIVGQSTLGSGRLSYIFEWNVFMKVTVHENKRDLSHVKTTRAKKMQIVCMHHYVNGENKSYIYIFATKLSC